MDPGLFLDMELRHSSVLMLPSPTARRQLCTLLTWAWTTSSLKAARQPARVREQLGPVGVHYDHYALYLGP